MNILVDDAFLIANSIFFAMQVTPVIHVESVHVIPVELLVGCYSRSRTRLKQIPEILPQI